MYCRIFEPGKVIISYGQKLQEMYFITKGTAIFFDNKGVTPFLQFPTHSYFGEYQLIFNLRANYVVKVGGKEDYSM
jgi:signal-transduction protein with cAMP-binding, CBS, and nucleotidyltransferase domain